MNTPAAPTTPAARLRRLEEERRKAEPLRLRLVWPEDLQPGERYDLVMTWPEQSEQTP